MIIPALVVVVVALCFSIVAVPEGHVAVYYRGGALLDFTSPSGFTWKLPLITSVAFVQTTMQTDEVVNIPCGTRGGVLIHFDKIEVVNQLKEAHVIETTRLYGLDYDKTWVYDKIHHEINEFCSKHTLQEVFIEKFETIDDSLARTLQESCKRFNTGVDIVAVRVTKPTIPEAVRRNYEQMEVEKTNLLVAIEVHKIAETEAKTESLRARIEAESASAVAQVDRLRDMMEKEAAQNISIIEDEMHMAAEKAKADAETYRASVEAAAHLKLLTPAYLKLQGIRAGLANSQIVHGDSIPTFMPNTDWMRSSKHTPSPPHADVML